MKIATTFGSLRAGSSNMAALGAAALLAPMTRCPRRRRHLFWLASQAVKPGGRSPLEVKKLASDSPRKLAMGFVTNLLNPKIAMRYLALPPQFIDPAAGSVQSLELGAIQIAISVNAMIALAAGSIALFLAARPSWMLAQR